MEILDIPPFRWVVMNHPLNSGKFIISLLSRPKVNPTPTKFSKDSTTQSFAVVY
jgi:hypothetical protein